MSGFLDQADALQAYLEKQTKLVGVPIIVDRQRSILVEVAKAVAGATGAAVTILWTGGTPVDPEADPIFRCRYSIMIKTKPVITEGNIPADELAEAVVLAIWQWNPERAHCNYEWRVLDVDLSPDPDHLAYEVIAEVKVTLNNEYQ